MNISSAVTDFKGAPSHRSDHPRPLRPEAGSTPAVFGTGTVGLAGVDARPERLELARELGATDTIDAPPFDTEVSLDVKSVLQKRDSDPAVSAPRGEHARR